MEPMRVECRSFRDQKNLRAKYILSLISKKEFVEILETNDNIYNRNIACLQIYDLFITIFRECINKITEERSAEAIVETYSHINQITKYANSELARLSYIYGRTINLFDLKSCHFINTRFTKTEYLSNKNSKLTHSFVDHPLRRMVIQTQASLKYIKKYDWRTSSYKIECPSCYGNIEAPFYTSTWANNNYRNTAVVKFKDLFPTSLTSLEFEATDTDINYFTAEVTFKYTVYNILGPDGRTPL